MSFQYPQQAVPEKKSSDPTLLIVAGLLVLMVFGGIVVVAAYFLRSTISPAPTETISFDVPTAREAYPAAVALIRAQDGGAALMSVAGAWTPTFNHQQLQAGRTGWTFYFYLPAKREMASVVSDRASSPRIGGLQPWQTPPALLDDQGWQYDSPAGMGAFLQKCGADLSADRGVVARLSAAAEDKALTWRYQVVSPDQQVVCALAFDAHTGQPRSGAQ